MKFKIAAFLMMIVGACAEAPSDTDTTLGEAIQAVYTDCGVNPPNHLCALNDPAAITVCHGQCGDPGSPWTSTCAADGQCKWSPHACGYDANGVCHRWYDHEHRDTCGGLVCPPGSPI